MGIRGRHLQPGCAQGTCSVPRFPGSNATPAEPLSVSEQMFSTFAPSIMVTLCVALLLWIQQPSFVKVPSQMPFELPTLSLVHLSLVSLGTGLLTLVSSLFSR